jgi:hypothetical protein
VAGTVRARGLLDRRVGRAGRAALARRRSLDDALSAAAATAYGARLRGARTVADAERAVAATALWHVRILAGWLPPPAVEPVRVLVAGYELANIDAAVAELATGRRPPPPFDLGPLATAWPRIAAARSARDVRAALARSAWGDPGADTPAGMRRGLVAAWWRRLDADVPEARAWAAGGRALAAARERLLAATGHAGVGAGAVADLRRELPARAAWALAGADDATDLWRCELAWWDRVERDAEALAAQTIGDRAPAIGCVALLLVDARETARAIGLAARGKTPEPSDVAA